MFTSVVYPTVLIACLLLAILGALTIARPGLHRALRIGQAVFRVIIVIEVVAIIAAVFSGDTPVLMTLMYVGAILATVFLLGVGRLGSAEAAARSPEAGRPILSPAQIAKVDGGAAILVALAQAVLTWRVHEIVLAAS